MMINNKASDMGYPDNFNAFLCDQRWGSDGDGTVSALEAKRTEVSNLLRDDAFDDIRNTLLDAFDDAIGEIERLRQ